MWKFQHSKIPNYRSLKIPKIRTSEILPFNNSKILEPKKLQDSIVPNSEIKKFQDTKENNDKNYINQVLLICFTNAMLRSEILLFKSIGKIVKIDHIQKDCFLMLLVARQVLLSIFHHSLFLPSKYFPSGTPR